MSLTYSSDDSSSVDMSDFVLTYCYYEKDCASDDLVSVSLSGSPTECDADTDTSDDDDDGTSDDGSLLSMSYFGSLL